MAQEFSFDIVCKSDPEEVRNSVQHATREVQNRWDFKGSNSALTLEGENQVVLLSEDEFKLGQLRDIFVTKLIKRGLSPKQVQYSDPKPAGHMMMRQVASFQSGLDREQTKEITRLIKDLKLKVQASIQGEQVRITGKSKDDLQTCMQAIRAANLSFETQFTNYR